MTDEEEKEEQQTSPPPPLPRPMKGQTKQFDRKSHEKAG